MQQENMKLKGGMVDIMWLGFAGFLPNCCCGFMISAIPFTYYCARYLWSKEIHRWLFPTCSTESLHFPNCHCWQLELYSQMDKSGCSMDSNLKASPADLRTKRFCIVFRNCFKNSSNLTLWNDLREIWTPFQGLITQGCSTLHMFLLTVSRQPVLECFQSPEDLFLYPAHTNMSLNVSFNKMIFYIF